MANEFIIKNGFRSQGNSEITGSLIISSSGATSDLRVGINKLIISGSQVTIGKSLTNGAQNVIDTAYRISATGSISTVDTVYGGNTTVSNYPGYGIYGNGVTAGGRFVGASDGGSYGIYATTADAGGSVSADFVAGYFEASSLSNNYSLQLVDGTQGFGKVLVSQTSTGKAQWGTRLSGSYDLTGSLAINGSVLGSSGNNVTSDALMQATLLYLSNNF